MISRAVFAHKTTAGENSAGPAHLLARTVGGGGLPRLGGPPQRPWKDAGGPYLDTVLAGSRVLVGRPGQPTSDLKTNGGRA